MKIEWSQRERKEGRDLDENKRGAGTWGNMRRVNWDSAGEEESAVIWLGKREKSIEPGDTG